MAAKAQKLLKELNESLEKVERGCFFDVEKALEQGKEALELFQTSQDLAGQARALHGIAAVRIAAHRFDAGMKTAKEALRLWQQLDDDDTAADEVFELQSIASWYLQASMSQQALPFAQEAHSLSSELQLGSDVESSCLELLVQAFLANGRIQRAAQVAHEAAEKYRQQGMKREEARALQSHLLTYLSKGDPWNALPIARKALQALRDADDEDVCGEAYLLRRISMLERQLNQLEEAVTTARQALDMCHQDPSSCGHEALLCTRHLLDLLLQSGQKKEARQLLEDEREHYIDADLRNLEGSVLLAQAAQQIQNKDSDDAVFSAEDAQAAFEDESDPLGEARSYRLAVLGHLSGGKYKEATKVLIDDALPAARKVGDTRGEAGCQLLLAHICELKMAANHRKDFETDLPRAIEAVKVAIALAEALGDVALQASSYCLMSRLYHLASRGKEAVEAVEAAVKLCHAAGDRAGEAQSRLLLGRTQLVCGEHDLAQDNASRALLLFRDLQHEVHERQAQTLLDELLDISAAAAATAAAEAAPAAQPALAAIPALQASANLAATPAVDVVELNRKVKSIVVDIIGMDDLTDDTPLMMAGLTSQAAVLLRNALGKELGAGSNLPFTMMFDYPSISALTDYLANRE
mmetsp:Transcript_27067/g.57454  ORF Transcript_27067/g.57454 Transcript_27067/m.57454 type:complete len:638 (-) Transcript_27067:8-1921(-)